MLDTSCHEFFSHIKTSLVVFFPLDFWRFKHPSQRFQASFILQNPSKSAAIFHYSDVPPAPRWLSGRCANNSVVQLFPNDFLQRRACWEKWQRRDEQAGMCRRWLNRGQKWLLINETVICLQAETVKSRHIGLMEDGILKRSFYKLPTFITVLQLGPLLGSVINDCPSGCSWRNTITGARDK